MYFANTGQIPKKNASDASFVAWILFVYHDKDDAYDIIHASDVDSFPLLNERSANYSEITTSAGQKDVLARFGCKPRKTPLSLILNKHPDEYSEGDAFLVTEWGKWPDGKTLKNDHKVFVTYFSDGKFPTLLEDSRDRSVLDDLKQFIRDHNFSNMMVGGNVSVSKFPKGKPDSPKTPSG